MVARSKPVKPLTPLKTIRRITKLAELTAAQQDILRAVGRIEAARRIPGLSIDVARRLKRILLGHETAPDLAARHAVEAEHHRQIQIKRYLEHWKQHGHAPTSRVFTSIRPFENWPALHAAVRAAHPEAFADIAIDGLVTGGLARKRQRELAHLVSKRQRFVITTAVEGCRVSPPFLAALQYYARENAAEILILISADPASMRSPGGHGYLAKELATYPLITTDTAINEQVFLSSIEISAKQIDPSTGLGRIGQRHGSFIYASPKQRLVTVPTGNQKFPRLVTTPGAVTLPDYRSELYMSKRTAYLAKHDHVLGALILELDGAAYHLRHVQAAEDGSFIDLGQEWSGTAVRSVRAEALIPGDIHVGDTDPAVWTAVTQVAATVRPLRLILHDLFNGSSLNPHHAKRTIDKALARAHLSLAQEAQLVAQWLLANITLAPELIVVKSNHDEFLERYLQACDFRHDPANYRLGLYLATCLHDGIDPLKAACDQAAGKEIPVRWLQRDEDYRIAGVQLGAHGDLGANGARGTLTALEQAYGECIVGHSHVPGILRGAMQTGTSTGLRLEYTQGPSSWLQSMAVLYSTGAKQLINVINGRWRRD